MTIIFIFKSYIHHILIVSGILNISKFFNEINSQFYLEISEDAS